MSIGGRAATLKWWHPDAEPFRWDYSQFGRYLHEVANRVTAWVRPAGDGSEKTVLRPERDELEGFIGHPFVEWVIYRQVRRVLSSLGGRANDGLAEHLACDVWAELAVALSRGVRYTHLSAWAFDSWFSCLVFNVARELLRHEFSKAVTVSSTILDRLFAPCTDLDAELDLSDKLAATLEAAAGLPTRQRKVVLGFLAGESAREIADDLGVHPQVVYRERDRALDKLRLALAAKYQVVWC